MKVVLTNITPNPEFHIVLSARACYDSYDKVDSLMKCPNTAAWEYFEVREPYFYCIGCSSEHDIVTIMQQDGHIILGDNDLKLLKHLMGLMHFSTLEHASATFSISGVSRALTHQLVRHRHLSFSQRSQRFVTEDSQFIVPESIRDHDGSSTLDLEYDDLMHRITSFYKRLVKSGVRKEDARFVLPNACPSSIVASGNMRAWFEFLQKRLAPQAQWEIRGLASRIREYLEQAAPNVFSKEHFLKAKDKSTCS